MSVHFPVSLNSNYASNIYELVIKVSNELEKCLSAVGATGRGHHEKIQSVDAQLVRPLPKTMRRLNWLRNKLVHEEVIPNRDDFIRTYEKAMMEFNIIYQREPNLTALKSNHLGLKDCRCMLLVILFLIFHSFNLFFETEISETIIGMYIYLALIILYVILVDVITPNRTYRYRN